MTQKFIINRNAMHPLLLNATDDFFWFLSPCRSTVGGDSELLEVLPHPKVIHPRLAAQLSYLAALLLGLLLAGLPSFVQGQTANLPPYWQWQNPLPQGYHLVDLHVFNDSTALGVGNAGTVVKTTNSGRTWRVSTTGTLDDLTTVHFADDQVGWTGYYSPTGTVRKTTDGGLTWTVQPLGVGNGTLVEDVQFLTPLQGYVLYYVGITRSTELRYTADGGQTWTLRSRLIQGDPTKVQFVSATVGYAAAGFFGGTIRKTTDGGVSWQPIAPTTDSDYYDLSFVSATRGWVCRNSSVGTSLYRTRDGGQTWLPQQLAPPELGSYAIQHVAFADTLRGIALAGNLIWTTSNGGQTWTSRPYAPDTPSLVTVQCQPSGAAWVLALGGRWLRSTTFGRRWAVADSVPAGRTRFVQFTDPTHGWVSKNDHTLARTADRGATWYPIDLITRTPANLVNWSFASLQGLHFIDRDTGSVAVMDYASYQLYSLTTQDRGQSWTVWPQSPPPQPFSPQIIADYRFVSARQGLEVGSGGLVRRTIDGGQTWTSALLPTGSQRRLFTSISWVGAQTVYVASDSLTLLRSTDGGSSFRPVAGLATFFASQGIQYSSLEQVYFTSARLGYVTLGNGPFLRTTDGGASWAYVSLPADQSIVRNAFQAVAFATPQEGWAISPDNLAQTTDGGQTWTRAAIFSPYNGYLSRITRIDRYNGWVSANNGPLLHYSERFIQADTSRTQRLVYHTGQPLTLAFTTEGSLSQVPADYRVQVSNPMGRFRRRQTTTLVPTSASIPGRLTVVLPASLPASTRYRLRVIAADSSVLGGDNAHDLTLVAAPLPVELAHFAAAPAGPAAVRLTWTTASEHNSAFFAVERSPDGRAWAERGRVAAAGSTTTTRTYAWPDAPAPAGQLFYRLRQVDLDGSLTYSPVRVVTLSGPSPVPGLIAYPSPAARELTVELPAPAGPTELVLLDPLGRVVRRTTTQLLRAVLDVRHLPAGTYLLRATRPAGPTLTQRVLVQP